MVDIQQRALGALEENATPQLARLIEPFPNPIGEGQDLRRDLQQLGNDFIPIIFLDAQSPGQGVVMHQQRVHPGRQQIRIRQIANPNRATPDLVLVGRTDAAAGGADLVNATRRLAGAVDRAMQRQDRPPRRCR